MMFSSSFAITRYASIHTLRTFFSLDADEVSVYQLYNAITATKNIMDATLEQYYTDSSSTWDLGSIPRPITDLHNYMAAKYILETMYPQKSDKIEILTSLIDALMENITSGKITVDNITPMGHLYVVNDYTEDDS